MKRASSARSILLSRHLITLLCVAAVVTAIAVAGQIVIFLFQLVGVESYDQIWYLVWLS